MGGSKSKSEARKIGNLLDAGPVILREKLCICVSNICRICTAGACIQGGGRKESAFPCKYPLTSPRFGKRANNKTCTHRVRYTRERTCHRSTWSPPHFPSLPCTSPSPIPSLYLADIYRVTTLFTTHAPLSTPVSQFEPDAAVCNYENRISSYGQKGLRGARVSPERPVKELLHPRGFVINLVGTDNRVGTSNRVR